MHQLVTALRKSWLYIVIALGTVGAIYLHASYSYYSRIVDEMIDNGAIGDRIDVYASFDGRPELMTTVSYQNREKRHLVQFHQLPDSLVRAVLSVEDKRFFEHSGLDFRRIAKATYVNLEAGRKQQGASTISMQLARSLWLNRQKTWKRKLAEMLIATRLEQRLSKVAIFELYANQVELSQQGTFNIHGFGEAARVFFGKEIGELTLAESATLAGMIQRPSYYSPARYPERARRRRNLVLQLMRKNGYSNSAELQIALESPLQTVSRPQVDYFEAPYFVDLMKRELRSKLPQSGEPHRGYRVNSTLDMTLQRDAVEAVRVGIQATDQWLARRAGSKASVGTPQVAVIVMDPHTGEVKALVGGRNYGDSQLNRAIAERQPGSIFKPFVYAAALQTTLGAGDLALTPATILRDEPTSFWFNRQAYTPNNFGREFHGDVTLRKALAKSLNVATVELAELVGYPAVVRLAATAGLERIDPTPSAALGSYEATPLEMAGAYTVFGNGGTYVEPHFISSVQDQAGATIYKSSPKRRRVLDPRVAYQMVSMLQEVVRTGTGAGIRSRGLIVPAAGKTGTSRDGWFAGFISDLLCVVWVGFDDHRDLDLEGSKSALPIWTEFMKRAILHGASTKPFRAPPGIIGVEVDPESGQLATAYCESSQLEVFVSGTEPQQYCDRHNIAQPAIAPNMEQIEYALPNGIDAKISPE